MSLTTMLRTAPEQFRGKFIKQIIGWAGDGKLLDGNAGSLEFREFLKNVPSTDLSRYAEECLAEKFENGGFALQDIVNQLGRRLGFTVQDGRYRGVTNSIGYDGLWESADGHHIVVEVKTTATFQIELDTIAAYRRELIRANRIDEDRSSILIVVGRDQTDDLEAQIRGSRHAWDIRLISVDGLKRLVNLREELDDPSIARKVSEILIPYEYTRVDRIIDLVFSATEEVLHEEAPLVADLTGANAPTAASERLSVVRGDSPVVETATERAAPVNFNEACAQRVAGALGTVLLKRSRTLFSSPDESIGVVCLVSKEHDTAIGPNYWYGYQEYAHAALERFSQGYVAFGCGSPQVVVLIPQETIEKWLSGMHVTARGGSYYSHIQIYREGKRLTLHRKKGESKIDISAFLVSGGMKDA